MVRTLLAGVLFFLCLQTGNAQQFPTRTITIVVPFPAGSISDVISRITAERMSKAVGQPVVVENRPGLNGSVGAGQGGFAMPNGWTGFFSPVATPVPVRARLAKEILAALGEAHQGREGRPSAGTLS